MYGFLRKVSNLGILAIISGICLYAFKNYAGPILKPLFPNKNRPLHYARIGSPPIYTETKVVDDQLKHQSKISKTDFEEPQNNISWEERQEKFNRLKTAVLSCKTDAEIRNHEDAPLPPISELPLSQINESSDEEEEDGGWLLPNTSSTPNIKEIGMQ